MIRIIITTLAILIAYQIAISTGFVSSGLGRDNFETNCITSESWRYKTSMPDVVIIGSSKTNFLDYKILKPNVLHLGYGGQGCLTGLEILNKSNTLPKLVLVEISDTLQWSADKPCIDLATDKFVPGDAVLPMQHRYQPTAVLLEALNMVAPQEIPNTETRTHLIAIQREELSIPLRDAKKLELKKNIERAQLLISELQRKGARVVFFDIPVERDIHDSQFVTETRTYINDAFQNVDCARLAYQKDYAASRTRDGTHLLPESAAAYSQWLHSEIAKLRP